MAINTSEVLDLSKENIQPLRQGRKAAHLKTALQAQIDPEVQQMLQKQREQFEYNIRMYEGDDPLEPYYNYVIWVEQSFPKMGRESNLIPLLEDVLTRFKDCEKYKQDRRLVQLLVKYISVLSNPVEIYQLVYDQGLGTMCSLLYKAWAEELDKVNDIKRADQVYQLGISCRAQPLDELENAHVQFQLSIARRMIEGNLNSAAVTNEPSRVVLSKLQPSKVKTSRISKDTAGVLQSRKSDLKCSNFATPKFQVYQEDSNNGFPRSDLRKHDKFPKGSIADRENVMQAGKWCGQKQRQSYRMSVIPTTPSFQIHEDPEAACQTVMTDFRALKTRREDNIPVAVFEPADPTKKTMYPKQLVYVGGRDVQLEEIRAAHYWKKVEKELETASVRPNEVMDISAEGAQLQHPSSENMAGVMPPKESQKFDPACKTVETELKLEKCGAASSISSVQTREFHSVDTATNPVQEAFECENFDTFKPCPIERNTTAEKHDSLQKIVPDKHNVSVFSHSPSTSMTVNTRAAMNIIEQMWESPRSDTEKTDQFRSAPLNKCPFFVYSEDAPQKTNRNPFDVFCDESAPKAGQPQFQVYSDENAANRKPNPFTIYSEENDAKPKQTPFPIFCDDLISNAEKESNSANTNQDPLADLWEDRTSKMNKDPFGLYTRDDAASKTDPFALNFGTPASTGLTDPFRGTPVSTGLTDPFRIVCGKPGSQARSSHFPVFCDDTDSKCPDGLSDNGLTKPRVVSKNYFDEDDLAKPMSSLKVMTAEQGTNRTPLPLIVPVNLQDTPLEPENKENRPPKDYSTPSERRPLSGILTPATNVPVNEAQSDDSDEDDDHRVCARNTEMDEETCSTRAFAIPLPASTPFSRAEYSRSSRKSLLYDGSYIADENNYASGSGTKTSQKTPTTNQQQLENSKRTNWITPNLSLILENSKELGGFSSSSSGNAGSKYMTS